MAAREITRTFTQIVALINLYGASISNQATNPQAEVKVILQTIQQDRQDVQSSTVDVANELKQELLISF